ncbi:hypothetical protein BZG01_02980 [Labilibaculum manganireducens]|uniref:Bacterial surface antigen (D15) domain-containing protein n=1 Tax=Labilibaculum manganireducens TaxID=1940525 RepID=A0A2N3IEG6_9BACT|nr:hypothetical protein [Labilibaculum manganireducens]PKQ68700.1 hypothetical protein BZG01_02980 [Labilibaculum manganireducens]
MMKFVRICFVFSFLITTYSLAKGQYFSTGQDPASINWKQINTKDFQIIFPEGYEQKAKYMAAVFQDLLQKGGKDLNHKPKKFSVVVHTQSAASNGMVAWAPKRMEIYNTSAPDNDAQVWIDHVTTHEYRHVIQMDKLEQGFTRFFNYVFGQQATVVVVGLYLPPWFLEGDAVCTETALSESGRGRLPFFEQELRAQLIEKGNYSYDKAINGSYQDYAADRYKLGYYLVGKARIHYGDELWENTLNRVGRRPLGITSFADGIKQGMNGKRDAVFDSLSEKQKEILAQGIKIEDIDWEQVKEKNTRADGKLMLYYDTMKELQWEWEVQDAQLNLTDFEPLANREGIYTNKRFPHVNESGEVIVLKEGLADAAYFEKISKEGKQEKLFVPGYDFNTGFDCKNGKLIWSERKDHLRWEKADKSVLVMYDTKSKRRSKIKNKNSLFAPAFSEDGKQIAAVETDELGDNHLVIINAESKLTEQRIDAGKGEFILSPKWDGNQSIVHILLNKKGKQLVSLDVNTGNRTCLFFSGKQEISQLEVSHEHIFFTAGFTGIDNVFAFDKSSGKVYQATSSRFGARDLHANGNQLYYSDYTSDGYLPVKTDYRVSNWKEWEGDYSSFQLAESLSEQLGEKLAPDTTNLARFEVKNYSKLGHLFNFHSWAPLFIDGLDQKSDIGVSVASQNKLSTLLTTVGYKKEQGYKNGQFYVNLSYQGWFPIIDSKLTVGNKEAQFATLADRISPVQVDTILVHRALKQWEWENSIKLPFDLSGGKYSTRIIPKITYSLAKLANIKYTPLAATQTNPLGLGEYDFGDKNITQEIMEYQIFAYNIAKKAPRDVQYQWAQVLELNYRHTPFGDSKLGETWSAEGHLYFPGFVKHHGIKMYGGYQNRSSCNSRFSNMIKSPRGMTDIYGEDIFSTGFDYALPLFYPDWNLGPLAYFKRVKMNTFIDYGYQKGKVSDVNQNLFAYDDAFTSFGAELSTDLHVLRFSAPVDLGIRVGYEDQTGSMFANLLISFSLSAF